MSTSIFPFTDYFDYENEEKQAIKFLQIYSKLKFISEYSGTSIMCQ